MTRVCVAGGGPAGLAAAIFAARAGAEVTVAERNDRCGLKLLTTGGGHCNVTNIRPADDWPGLFGRRGRFIVPALKFFPRERLETWLAEMGEPAECTDGRHVFPMSRSAKRVRDALVREAEQLGVTFRYGVRARGVAVDLGEVGGLDCEDGVIKADRVVLAVGGRSYPATGSTWDVEGLARGVGHWVTAPYPGLVGLRVKNLDAVLAGLVLPNAVVTFRRKGVGTIEGRGELLLTHGGVSGPAVLDMSADIAETLELEGGVELRIRWRSGAGWREKLDEWRKNHGASMPVSLISKEGIPQRLARWLCDAAGIGSGAVLARLRGNEIETLMGLLSNFPAQITGTEGWDKAMVTRGGVDVREISPDTMASRIVPGLYFAGEMIDMDGPCGGYNLHWAFASGALAGVSAARE